MKILILSTISGCNWAGTEEVWHQFAEEALARGNEVMLAADSRIASSDRVAALQQRGLLVSARCPFRSHRAYALKEKIITDHWRALVFAPDICLINSGSPLDLDYNPHLGAFVDRLKCKKVFFCHFNSDRLAIKDRGNLEKRMKAMEGLVFVCEANKKELECQVAAAFPKAHVLLNSSRVTLPSPLEFPDSGTVRFACVARLDSFWKGQDILIRALSRPPWLARKWSLDFFGVGKDAEYLGRLAALHEIQSLIEFHGYEQSVEKIWEQRHVLLLPSRGEGAPLVVLEAMSCGRPVVATDVGGNSEIIEDGINGYIAEAPTIKSLSKTLERAWENRSKWKEMGQLAHAKAKEIGNQSPSKKLLSIIQSI